jgi:hypothetical protein
MKRQGTKRRVRGVAKTSPQPIDNTIVAIKAQFHLDSMLKVKVKRQVNVVITIARKRSAVLSETSFFTFSPVLAFVVHLYD